jgi:hypothetical protein
MKFAGFNWLAVGGEGAETDCSGQFGEKRAVRLTGLLWEFDLLESSPPVDIPLRDRSRNWPPSNDHRRLIFTTAGTEDTEGAQRQASDDLKFEIMNAFLCVPSESSVFSVVNLMFLTFN